MKLIIAIVQPFMAAEVVRVLHDLPSVTGATLTDVRGFGRARQAETSHREAVTNEARKLRVEVVVRDEAAAEVAQAIRGAARTGNRGDGKVFVLPVERAMRVANDDEGDIAV